LLRSPRVWPRRAAGIAGRLRGPASKMNLRGAHSRARGVVRPLLGGSSQVPVAGRALGGSVRPSSQCHHLQRDGRSLQMDGNEAVRSTPRPQRMWDEGRGGRKSYTLRLPLGLGRSLEPERENHSSTRSSPSSSSTGIRVSSSSKHNRLRAGPGKREGRAAPAGEAGAGERAGKRGGQMTPPSTRPRPSTEKPLPSALYRGAWRERGGDPEAARSASTAAGGPSPWAGAL
jgi:hypothetical protein